MKRFEDFNMKQSTMDFIRLNGFTEPTPIQQEVIPAFLRGRDVIGLSKTGTGKTHSFLIPLMERVDLQAQNVQAVITAPTRELAAQIYENARKMQEIEPELRIRLFVGGQDRDREIQQLSVSQPHIAIGTPGRIRDMFLNAGALRIDNTGILIVDEADMTLEYGFLDEIDAFAGRMADDLEMLAFSATMPDQLKPFLKKYMHHPITFRISDDEDFNPKIRHILVPCYHHTYAETIKSILPGFSPFVCLIFANTREMAAEIASALRADGTAVSELHGDLESRKRKQAMKEIADSRHTYVVCTDLAARGIDIPTVTHIISCGFPSDLEYYIHRAGRTGRAGSDGICYALYHENDDQAIRSLMKRGIKFEHSRYRNGEWSQLRPYGQRFQKKEDEMDKKISMMMTKKNTKVKPGYKKKRKAAIEQLQRKKRREFIREKIKEEKKARYRQAQAEKNRGEDR